MSDKTLTDMFDLPEGERLEREQSRKRLGSNWQETPRLTKVRLTREIGQKALSGQPKNCSSWYHPANMQPAQMIPA
jgi:hypothetical protein